MGWLAKGQNRGSHFALAQVTFESKVEKGDMATLVPVEEYSCFRTSECSTLFTPRNTDLEGSGIYVPTDGPDKASLISQEVTPSLLVLSAWYQEVQESGFG